MAPVSRLEGLRDRFIDALRNAGARASDLGGNVAERATEFGGRVADRASDLGSRAAEFGGRVADRASDLGERVVKAPGAAFGKNIGATVEESAQAARQQLHDLSSQAQKEMGDVGAKVRSELHDLSGQAQQEASAFSELGKQEAIRHVSALAKQLAPGMAAGGVTGALGGSTHDDARWGAGRGMIAGAFGGLGGRAMGPGMARAALGGAMLGAPAGAFFGKDKWSKESKPSFKTKKSAVTKNKYAGVTLDWYDDQGDTLKALFPTLESLPTVIKQASILPFEKLSQEDFALRAVDNGNLLCKFACHDPGTTAMSVIYFMEHGDKLPEVAQKTAAANLVEACVRFELQPPEALVKVAAQKTDSVDITGQSPAPRIKVASSPRSEDYAVVLPDGSRHYPIHTWDLVKKAELYYHEEGLRMQPEIRRQFAVKLASKAYEMGYPLSSEIFEAGASQWAPSGHLKAALEMRKVACAPNDGSRQFLDELFQKRASVNPDTYAEVLRRFDVQHGFDRVWDRVVLDPWASTFGINKVADVVWEDGADRVTSEQLATLAANDSPALKEMFTESMVKEFRKDPVGIFESMPAPQKRVLARMAADTAGESESSGPVEAQDKKAALNPMAMRNIGQTEGIASRVAGKMDLLKKKLPTPGAPPTVGGTTSVAKRPL